jgi:hypothetical protein
MLSGQPKWRMSAPSPGIPQEFLAGNNRLTFQNNFLYTGCCGEPNHCACLRCAAQFRPLCGAGAFSLDHRLLWGTNQRACLRRAAQLRPLRDVGAFSLDHRLLWGTQSGRLLTLRGSVSASTRCWRVLSGSQAAVGNQSARLLTPRGSVSASMRCWRVLPGSQPVLGNPITVLAYAARLSFWLYAVLARSPWIAGCCGEPNQGACLRCATQFRPLRVDLLS